MNPETPVLPAPRPEVELTTLEARVLGCLIEKELTTPDLYPLTLNSLVNACNQRSNRDPVMEVSVREVESALDGLRSKKLATLFSGADARVFKYRQTIELVFAVPLPGRVILCELLIRGAQTVAELRTRTERMQQLSAEEVEGVLQDLAQRPSGALVRRLARQPGQKELRWAQLLTGEPVVPAGDRVVPVVAGAATMSSSPTFSSSLEQRVGVLEAEVERLRAELGKLRESLGGN